MTVNEEKLKTLEKYTKQFAAQLFGQCAAYHLGFKYGSDFNTLLIVVTNFEPLREIENIFPDYVHQFIIDHIISQKNFTDYRPPASYKGDYWLLECNFLEDFNVRMSWRDNVYFKMYIRGHPVMEEDKSC